MNGLIIYRTWDDSRHRATDAEQAAHDAWVERERDDLLDRMCRDYKDWLAEKQMLKNFRAKGLIPTHTRGTFAWRMSRRPYSAVRFESYIPRIDKLTGAEIPPTAPWLDWDYAPVGEATWWRLVPRLKWTGLEVYDVWVVTTLPTGRKRRKLVRDSMSSLCDSGECKRQTCAYCWAGEHLNLEENQTIKIERRTGKVKVDDPSGISAKGKQNQKAQAMGEDQRAMHAMTSTQRHHKKGVSEW